MLARAESLSPRIHLDRCDGDFADSTTIGLGQMKVLKSTQVDLHLMLEKPGEELPTALELKPKLIIFHAEAKDDLYSLISKCAKFGVKAGLAILPRTQVDRVADLIREVEHVLVFTGTLGKNGGVFHQEALSTVSVVKELNQDVEVSIDGGVTDKNASLAVAAGVDVLYAGAYFQQADDPEQAYKAIVRQIEVVS